MARGPRSTLAFVLAASLAASLAAPASPAFAQEPNPPTGGPQEPTGTETTPTTTSPTGGQQPTTTGQLPRTGWDAALYFALGMVLLLAGARLRVLTRIKQVVQRVRRVGHDQAAADQAEAARVGLLHAQAHVQPAAATP